MNKFIFSLMSICLATGSALGMEASFSNNVLTIKKANGYAIKLNKEDLKDSLQDLCNADPENIEVLYSRTTDNTVKRIQLTQEETIQYKIALLSCNAQDGPLGGKHVHDIARLQPLPKVVHDLVYGTQPQPAPASQPVIHPESTISDRLFNKTTLSACAVCAVAAWIAAKKLGQSLE